MQVLSHGWNVPSQHTHKAKYLMGKFKSLRRVGMAIRILGHPWVLDPTDAGSGSFFAPMG
jgi:hypothetical protein